MRLPHLCPVAAIAVAALLLLLTTVAVCSEAASLPAPHSQSPAPAHAVGHERLAERLRVGRFSDWRLMQLDHSDRQTDCTWMEGYWQGPTGTGYSRGQSLLPIDIGVVSDSTLGLRVATTAEYDAIFAQTRADDARVDALLLQYFVALLNLKNIPNGEIAISQWLQPELNFAKAFFTSGFPATTSPPVAAPGDWRTTLYTSSDAIDRLTLSARAINDWSRYWGPGQCSDDPNFRLVCPTSSPSVIVPNQQLTSDSQLRTVEVLSHPGTIYYTFWLREQTTSQMLDWMTMDPSTGAITGWVPGDLTSLTFTVQVTEIMSGGNLFKSNCITVNRPALPAVRETDCTHTHSWWHPIHTPGYNHGLALVTNSAIDISIGQVGAGLFGYRVDTQVEYDAIFAKTVAQDDLVSQLLIEYFTFLLNVAHVPNGYVSGPSYINSLITARRLFTYGDTSSAAADVPKDWRSTLYSDASQSLIVAATNTLRNWNEGRDGPGRCDQEPAMLLTCSTPTPSITPGQMVEYAGRVPTVQVPGTAPPYSYSFWISAGVTSRTLDWMTMQPDTGEIYGFPPHGLTSLPFTVQVMDAGGKTALFQSCVSITPAAPVSTHRQTDCTYDQSWWRASNPVGYSMGLALVQNPLIDISIGQVGPNLYGYRVDTKAEYDAIFAGSVAADTNVDNLLMEYFAALLNIKHVNGMLSIPQSLYNPLSYARNFFTRGLTEAAGDWRTTIYADNAMQISGVAYILLLWNEGLFYGSGECDGPPSIALACPASSPITLTPGTQVSFLSAQVPTTGGPYTYAFRQGESSFTLIAFGFAIDSATGQITGTVPDVAALPLVVFVQVDTRWTALLPLSDCVTLTRLPLQAACAALSPAPLLEQDMHVPVNVKPVRVTTGSGMPFGNHASGGHVVNPHFHWSISSSVGDTRLTINPTTGALGGTPGAASGYTITIEDASGARMDVPLSGADCISIAPKLEIACAALQPKLSLQAGYSVAAGLFPVIASAGTGWSFAGGDADQGHPGSAHFHWLIHPPVWQGQLSMDVTTGELNGTPGAQIEYFVIVEDAAGARVHVPLTGANGCVTITSTPLAATCAALSPSPVLLVGALVPSGLVPVVVTAQTGLPFAAHEAHTTSQHFHFSIAPLVPGGLTMDETTGELGGTPTFPSSEYAVTVQDAAGATVVVPLSGESCISIVPPLAAACTAYDTAPLLEVGVNVPDGFAPVTVTAGTGVPYGDHDDHTGSHFHWTISPDDAGLSIGLTTGVVTGAPSFTSGYEVTVTDAAAAGGSVTVSLDGCITIAPALAAVCTVANPPPALEVGVQLPASFNPVTVTAQTGVAFGSHGADGHAVDPHFHFSIAPTNGGLSIDETTGVVSGTPNTQSGYEVTVEDAAGGSVTVPLTGADGCINIAPALSAACPVRSAPLSLAVGFVMAGDTHAAVTVDGGVGPFSYQYTPGPSGLVIDSSAGGTINWLEGTPSSVASSYSVQVTDSLGAISTTPACPVSVADGGCALPVDFWRTHPSELSSTLARADPLSVGGVDIFRSARPDVALSAAVVTASRLLARLQCPGNVQLSALYAQLLSAKLNTAKLNTPALPSSIAFPAPGVSMGAGYGPYLSMTELIAGADAFLAATPCGARVTAALTHSITAFTLQLDQFNSGIIVPVRPCEAF